MASGSPARGLSCRSRVCRWLTRVLAAVLVRQGTDVDVRALRRRTEWLATLAWLPAGTRVAKASFGGVSAQWVAAENAQDDRVVLYLHGGGYTFGSGRTHLALCARISAASGARVLLPDYRLAPEHPFPAALEDATAAYRRLLERGTARERIAIAGDSAGGGLAIAAAIALRDSATPLPAAIACISPWTDLTLSGKTIHTRARRDPMVTERILRHMAATYVRDNDPCNPLISPLFAGLEGLPPLLLQTGSDEILLDDSRRLAKKAVKAGVAVTLDVFPGMWHVWHLLASFMPEAKTAVRRLGAFIRTHLAWPARSRPHPPESRRGAGERNA